VEVRVDQRGQEILKDQKSAIKKATEEDWTTEYLDRILSIRIVEDIEQAIDHINQYGSGHSDTIVTTSREKAERFMEGVDSAAVYWNASTRFTDGAEFGMGAEIGISTDKIGARGPMGLNELTSYKWLGYGTGQIRT
jgi:glutamate-5-semialdehyde dehydrogenase